MIVDSRGVEVVRHPVDKDKLGSEPSVLYLLQEGVVEPRDVGTGLVL